MMKDLKPIVTTIGIFISLLTLLSSGARADNLTIQTQGISFDPQVLIIQPGDTVQWTDMSVHSSLSVDELIPEHAEAWQSSIGESFEKTFTQEGIYIYQCQPHSKLGMAGAIIVGTPQNLEQLKAHKIDGPLQKAIEAAIESAERL